MKLYFYITVSIILIVMLLVLGMSTYAFVVTFGWGIFFIMMATSALALHMFRTMPTDDNIDELDSDTPVEEQS